MHKVPRVLKRIFFYTTLILVCFEIALRILSYAPYANDDYKVESQPGNAFVGDEELGIRLKPGQYTITLNDSVTFTTTHGSNNQREIPYSSAINNAPEISFMGCSFTYGYGVNDGETFAALTQHNSPNKKVNNYGVIGYGTVQSLLQLQQKSDLESGDIILLCFSTYHFMRNSLSNEYRSRLKIGFENSSENLEENMASARFPAVKDCTGDPFWVNWDQMYSNWPGRTWFSSINFIQTSVDRLMDRKFNPVELAGCLIEKMNSICLEKGAKFGVICLDQDKRTEDLKNNLAHIPWLDVQFDFGNAEITNIPYDSHPNEKGHHFIHQKITPFIDELGSK